MANAFEGRGIQPWRSKPRQIDDDMSDAGTSSSTLIKLNWSMVNLSLLSLSAALRLIVRWRFYEAHYYSLAPSFLHLQWHLHCHLDCIVSFLPDLLIYKRLESPCEFHKIPRAGVRFGERVSPCSYSLTERLFRTTADLWLLGFIWL